MHIIYKHIEDTSYKSLGVFVRDCSFDETGFEKAQTANFLNHSFPQRPVAYYETC